MFSAHGQNIKKMTTPKEANKKFVEFITKKNLLNNHIQIFIQEFQMKNYNQF